jgi:uncharacterized Zn finger protein (UPF0148 family)
VNKVIKKNSIPFEEFEKEVMEKIMEKDTSINAILKEQYKKARVVSRDFTGVGFFTDFELADDAPNIEEEVAYGYGNVTAIINDFYQCGFVLFIKDGKMICLEGYTAQDEWPEIITSYTLAE